jgi:hypothetical protein
MFSRRKRLVRSYGRVKEDEDLWELRTRRQGGSRRAQKNPKKPETNGRLASFLLLPSHRAYGIFGMGIP